MRNRVDLRDLANINRTLSTIYKMHVDSLDSERNRYILMGFQILVPVRKQGIRLVYVVEYIRLNNSAIFFNRTLMGDTDRLSVDHIYTNIAVVVLVRGFFDSQAFVAQRNQNREEIFRIKLLGKIKHVNAVINLRSIAAILRIIINQLIKTVF